MAPRVNLPPKKNRARCGIKYQLRIVKGDLPADSEFKDEDQHEDMASLAVADVDTTEGNEHHLQAALATKAVFIPTPAAEGKVSDYNLLYPPDKWKKPATYIYTTTTVEEAVTNAFLDYDLTYYMDEVDMQWLERNNQEARGEGTSAAAEKLKGGGAETGLPVSISEDEFELVMGLLDKLIEPTGFHGSGPDFSAVHEFFDRPLPNNIFASFAVPAWVPPPPSLACIARLVFPHWKQRRVELDGRKIHPSINYDEFDFANEPYVCFRRRDPKAVRKTRAGQAVNNADKLVQLHYNFSQALAIAEAVLEREGFKQLAAIESETLWNARKPMADLFRSVPGLITKADEERLTERPKKIRPNKSTLPKVKVLPPSHPGGANGALAPAILPSERAFIIQKEILQSVQEDTDWLRSHACLDVTDVRPHGLQHFSRAHSAYRTRIKHLWYRAPTRCGWIFPVKTVPDCVGCECALGGVDGDLSIDGRVSHMWFPYGVSAGTTTTLWTLARTTSTIRNWSAAFELNGGSMLTHLSLDWLRTNTGCLWTNMTPNILYRDCNETTRMNSAW
ncbi:unnamed protein product [Mycena citricolor]|uniref:Enhancer of polycomb-like protein n=1 Tax=Mycena citricolor TaxID=2018698 RepID=A0AAD2GWL6_9AGAR|nr:unnamed protein product [Mycena citricolor]